MERYIDGSGRRVRPELGSALQRACERSKGLGKVYGALGARRSYWLEWRSSEASPTTAMVDGGARLAGELATAKSTAGEEEGKKGGAHRVAKKGQCELRSSSIGRRRRRALATEKER